MLCTLLDDGTIRKPDGTIRLGIQAVKKKLGIRKPATYMARHGLVSERLPIARTFEGHLGTITNIYEMVAWDPDDVERVIAIRTDAIERGRYTDLEGRLIISPKAAVQKFRQAGLPITAGKLLKWTRK